MGRDDLEVAFQDVLGLAERARRAPDEAARSAAPKIIGVGISRSIVLSLEKRAALAQVIDGWGLRRGWAAAAGAAALERSCRAPQLREPEGRRFTQDGRLHDAIAAPTVRSLAEALPQTLWQRRGWRVG